MELLNASPVTQVMNMLKGRQWVDRVDWADDVGCQVEGNDQYGKG